MSTGKDLTRWNRAGLSRFRYVDGNAVTFLETLRQGLIDRFTDPKSDELQWQELVDLFPGDGTENERLLEQYNGKRRDLGWEMVRALARAVHILTEYIDAYANEGYLGTATQWDNVRRLVEMLDYHPAPPASAFTTLVLLAKGGKQGTVEKGLQVKNAPADGSSPVTFETLEDIAADHRLNKLRLRHWDKSQLPFGFPKRKAVNVSANAEHLAKFHLAKPLKGVSKGGRGVLLIDLANKSVGLPVRVQSVTNAALVLVGPPPPADLGLSVKRHKVRLLLKPKVIQSPRLTGNNTVLLDSDHSLNQRSMVAWLDGGKWYAADIIKIDGRRLALSGGEAGHVLPPKGVALYRLNRARAQRIGGSYRIMLPLAIDRRTGTVWGSNLNRLASNKVKTETASGLPIYDYVTNVGSGSVAYYLDKKTETSGAVIQRSLQELVFTGDPGELTTGQWALLVDRDDHLYARKIATLDKAEHEYSLSFSEPAIGGLVETLYAGFATEIRPADHNRNRLPVSGNRLLLESLPAGLIKGRQLVLANDSGAFAVKVTDVESTAKAITVTPAVPCRRSDPSATAGCDFARHDTIIYGNVVTAGNGESKPQKILGSGDATVCEQSFVLKEKHVSFVADATQSTGVRADIEVAVDGRIWKQVATRNDSEATDPHYAVRMTEEGYLEIGFGDGKLGRRLPTGTNNLRISYRVGTGLDGNLLAGELVKPAKHPLVESVAQPFAASGGNSMEGVESLRDNAAASLLCLERAVSLSDFTHLATTYSSVWQARAFAEPTGWGRHESVKVVAVPAGGGKLGKKLKQALKDYLRAHAVPGVEVAVFDFEPVCLDLDINLQVRSDQYDLDKVEAAVRKGLLAGFDLKHGKLGEPFYRGALFAVVEAVAGVESSVCVIREETLRDAQGDPLVLRRVARGSDGSIRSLRPSAEQVIFVDPKASKLTVVAKEYSQ